MSAATSSTTGLAYEAGKAVAEAARRMSTPRKLVGMRTAIWVLAALLFLVGETTLNRARFAVKTIGRDSAPSIVAAEEIGLHLADLDANVANYLLGTAEHRGIAANLIEQRRIKVIDGLIAAAQNITYGESEKIPIQAMSLDFGRYLERAAEARLRHDRGDEAGARDSYWAATDLLHGELLVEAEELESANKSHLDGAYEDQLVSNEGAEALAILVGAGLVGLLLYTQLFLFRKMHRVLNVPLALATVVAVVFTGYLYVRFGQAREDLRVAKKDAFDSIYALVRARRIAYDANGDESRYVLDSTPARAYEREFKKKVAALTSKPQLGTPGEQELESLATVHRKAGISGLLWDELGNVTFEGEYDAAARTVREFEKYYAVDARVRTLEQSGRHADAVELCIGTRPDESNAQFDRFDHGLTDTLGINQHAFDAAIERGDDGLRQAEYLDPGLAVLIALLAWFGLRARLKEYS